jgi:hypothetical protein
MNVAVAASATGTVNITPPTTIPDDVCGLDIHLDAQELRALVAAGKLSAVPPAMPIN